MKAQELKSQNEAELKEELFKLRKEQFQLRMQRASGQLGQTHLLAETRRNIARIKTVLREKRNG